MGYRFNEFPAERQEASSPAQKAAARGLSGAICGISFFSFLFFFFFFVSFFFSQTTRFLCLINRRGDPGGPRADRPRVYGDGNPRWYNNTVFTARGGGVGDL